MLVVEAGREAVLDLLAGAGRLATSRLSYVEARAAVARGRREGRFGRREEARAERTLEASWSELDLIEIDDELCRDAATLLREHPLRAGDAIHLASARMVAPPAPADLTVACWDRRLWEAAAASGFRMVPAVRPG